jgi:uncharacterized protein
MARPKCTRLVNDLPNVTYFKPRGIPLVDLNEITLTVDEYEAMRLADFEGLYQEEAAEQMHISRATFGRILASVHKKIAGALINGAAIRIEGGVVKMAQKRLFQCSDCEHTWEVPYGTGRPATCPQCGSANLHRAESDRGPMGGGRHMGSRRRLGCRAAARKESN